MDNLHHLQAVDRKRLAGYPECQTVEWIVLGHLWIPTGICVSQLGLGVKH
jgi:hypothetical protein